VDVDVKEEAKELEVVEVPASAAAAMG
jgi:hypothetical protein